MAKHILITGGSDGLGKLAAQKLIAAGHKVTILSRNPDKTKAVAAEIDCHYVVADVADAAQVGAAIKQAVARSGEVDILINNAGVWVAGKLEDNAPEEIKRAVDVNTLGTIYCTRAVVPGMKARRGGRIINVISQVGLQGKAERSVYAASKWAITGFTKSLQAELKPHHISVVGFYPGGMCTSMFAKVGDMKDRSTALDPSVAADALVYICGLSNDVDIPECGIQSLNY